jgi:hypothetical protein
MNAEGGEGAEGGPVRSGIRRGPVSGQPAAALGRGRRGAAGCNDSFARARLLSHLGVGGVDGGRRESEGALLALPVGKGGQGGGHLHANQGWGWGLGWGWVWGSAMHEEVKSEEAVAAVCILTY